MKLNLFSPLPPARTRSARAAWHVLPALRELADVTLWTVQDSWDPEIERLAPVRRCGGEGFWGQVNSADMSVYHLAGCPEQHAELWQLSRVHPGVVVLFDLQFYDLVTATYLEFAPDEARLRAVMGREYGEEGREEAERLIREGRALGPLRDRFDLLRYVVETALGVMVHSRSAEKALRGLGDWPLLRAPLAWSAASPAASCPRRDAEVRQLIHIGDLWRDHRVTPLLEVLARLPERERLRLDVYGRLWPQPAVEQVRNALGLGELVRFHGEVADETVEAALLSADLAINLRHPTLGEVSSTQLRIWEHSLPSLVTQAGWFAEVPEGAVAFVRPEREQEDIGRRLEAFLAAPEGWAGMGRRGRATLEAEHSPALGAEGLVELAREAVRFRRSYPAVRLAARAARRTEGWPPAAGRTTGESVSRVIAELFGGAAEAP